MPAKLKIYVWYWSPSYFRDNSCLLKEAKSLWNHFLKSRIQNLLYRNIAHDVLFDKHFTDWDYLNRFSRYERFCEPRYL